jgi:hypothetical protein
MSPKKGWVERKFEPGVKSTLTFLPFVAGVIEFVIEFVVKRQRKRTLAQTHTIESKSKEKRLANKNNNNKQL